MLTNGCWQARALFLSLSRIFNWAWGQYSKTILAAEPCNEEARGQVSWTRGSISLKSNRMLDREDSSAYSPIVHATDIPASTVAELALDVGPSSTADAPANLPSLETVAAITATSDQAETSGLRKAEVQSSSQLNCHTILRPKETSFCCNTHNSKRHFLVPFLRIRAQ